MTWTKLGSEFLTDPALLRLPRGARLLHVEATVWSNQHGTDGHVPSHMLGRISDEPDTDTAAAQLTAAGLWQAADDGWTLPGFLDDQPSAEDVDRAARSNRERQRRYARHRDGDHSLCHPRYCRDASTNPAANALGNASSNAVSDAVSNDPRTVRTDRTDRKGGYGSVKDGTAEHEVEAAADPARAGARPVAAYNLDPRWTAEEHAAARAARARPARREWSA